MTLLITSGQIAGAAWVALSWAFLIVVAASILYARWRRREHEDAAETARVMESLKPDTTHAHEQDAF